MDPNFYFYFSHQTRIVQLSRILNFLRVYDAFIIIFFILKVWRNPSFLKDIIINFIQNRYFLVYLIDVTEIIVKIILICCLG